MKINQGKQMKYKSLVFAVLMGASVTSNAEFFSANRLLSLMTSSSESDRSVAYGYVAGVFDLGMGTVHCAPESVTLRQVFDMTQKLIQNVPEQREKSADQFVVAAISGAWPCKQPSTRRPQPV